MLYTPPTGGAANDSYTGKNVAAGLQGSKIPPGAAEFPQRELVAIITDVGMSPTNVDLAQAAQAIRSGKLNFWVDTGTADALAIAPARPYADLGAGVSLSIQKGNAANATPTPKLTVSGITQTIVKDDGTALAIGDLPAGCIFTVRGDGARLRVQGLRKSDTSVAVGATSKGGLALDANNNFLLSLIANLTADNRPMLVGGDVLPVGRLADGLMVGAPASALASYVLSNIVSTNTFQQVAVNPVLYVDAANGSDANNGLTTQTAFKTIAAALAKGTSAYSFASSNLTIQLAPGTYAPPSNPYLPVGSGQVVISGDTTGANKAAYIIQGASSGGNYIFITSSTYVFSGLTINNNDVASGGTIAVQGPTYLINVDLVSTTNNTTGAHLFIGGALTIEAGCTARGNMKWLFFGSNFASITVGQTFRILGDVTYSGSTLLLTNTSEFQLLNGATISASGTVTGTRYILGNYSVASVNGGGVNAIPGSVAGTTSNAIYNP